MNDTPEATDEEATNVLRPFVESESDPLPPIEPPRLRATESAPVMPTDISPGDVIDAPEDGPVEGPVPDIPLADLALADLPLAEEPDETDVEDEADEIVTLTEPVQVDDTISLPRKPFMIGIGVVSVLLLALLGLWQNAGGESDVDTAVGPVPSDDIEPGDAADVAPTDSPATDSPATDSPATDSPATDTVRPVDPARVQQLNDEIVALEAALADLPVASLPGSALQRVIVPGDAKFVSAIAGSVAVVGPFGQLATIDPNTNTIVAAGDVAGTSTRILRTGSAIWITNYNGGEILRVDPATLTVIGRMPFAGPDGLAKDGGTLVLASYDEQFVARFDPASGEITQRVDVGGSPTAVFADPELGLWVAIYDTGELVQIDPASFDVIRRVSVGAGPVGLAGTPTGLWVANHEAGTVARVNPSTGAVEETINVGVGPTDLVGAWGSLWVTTTDAGELVQIDGSTGETLSRTPLGGSGLNGGPTGISVAGDTLWVAMVGEQSVVRIDRADLG